MNKVKKLILLILILILVLINNKYNILKIEPKKININKTYLKIGEKLKIKNTSNLELKYFIEDEEIKERELTENDYEKWITVKAYKNNELKNIDRAYFSKLPVIYINTENNEKIDSKEEYKQAQMTIQNNKETTKFEYNGKIKIKGRGNASWDSPKKSYKIKLENKTDLFNMGENKNWILISNYVDESFLRNATAFQISKKLNLETMDFTWVTVILNDDYIGNYLLCKQIEINENRINIFNWEQEAENNAQTIYINEKNKGIKLNKEELENQLKTNLSWITEKTINFNNKEYTINKQYDISGGYLFELSGELDEPTCFKTENKLNIMLKSPKYLYTNKEMMNYVTEYWNNLDNAYRKEDGYIETKEGKKHYTELVDIDSLVSYWLTMEIMGNNDAFYKSRFAYKNQNEPLKFGPVWDFDWGNGCFKDTSNPKSWKISKINNEQAFYKELLDDPLFIIKATEKYWEIRPYLEEIITENGILDNETKYLYESGKKDEKKWNRNFTYKKLSRGFEKDAEYFKNYLKERIQWLDEQMKTDKKLLESTYTEYSSTPYIKTEKEITFELKGIKDTAPAPADKIINNENQKIIITTNNENIKKINIYLNGLYYDTSINKKTEIELPQDKIIKNKKNIISVIAKNKNNETIYKNFITFKIKE